MKELPAERLLGGHATGTLSAEERRRLYEAALRHQPLFDALMDEEALRELLADPEARSKVLAALDEGRPAVVPFWRRAPVLGAAASLLVASLAGLTLLRSPRPEPPSLKTTVAPAPLSLSEAPQAMEPPARSSVPRPASPAQRPGHAAQATASPEQVPAALPPPAALPTGGAAPPEEARARPAAQDTLATQREAPRAAALVEALPSPAADTRAKAAPAPQVARKATASREEAVSSGAVGGVVAGVVGGVVGGVVDPPWAPVKLPDWRLVPGPGGASMLQVASPAGSWAVALRRHGGRVEVVPLGRLAAADGSTRWQGRVRLEAGDILDLYLLPRPAADPLSLPAEGPLEGQRYRLHPVGP